VNGRYAARVLGREAGDGGTSVTVAGGEGVYCLEIGLDSGSASGVGAGDGVHDGGGGDDGHVVTVLDGYVVGGDGGGGGDSECGDGWEG